MSLDKSNALPALLSYRQQIWQNHCNYVLSNLLIPMANQWQQSSNQNINYGAVLIENRIDTQWYFSVLNTILMAPSGTQICIVTDKESLEKAKGYLKDIKLPIEPWWGVVEELVPGTDLKQKHSYNHMLKQKEFWESLPHEKLLITQTDSLLVQPLPKFFLNFPYLGAPFLPKQQSEYFEERKKNGELQSFYKVDTEIHGCPNPLVYPHLHGNGGLSIRQRNLMVKICHEQAKFSSEDEMEDVFFSKNIKNYCEPAPLEIAKAFACESRYNASSIGSHAAWKYFNSIELGEHLETHWKHTWALAMASGN